MTCLQGNFSDEQEQRKAGSDRSACTWQVVPPELRYWPHSRFSERPRPVHAPVADSFRPAAATRSSGAMEAMRVGLQTPVVAVMITEPRSAGRSDGRVPYS